MAGDNRQRITAPRKGQAIRAAFLHSVAEAINDMRPGTPRAAPVAQATSIDGGDNLTADEVFYEIGRTSTTVRVENPDDAEQYVDVERIDAVMFRSTDGRTLLLRFNN